MEVFHSGHALHSESEKNAPLRELLGGYQIAFMSQVSQSVACNGLHPLAQRCCRWLLMSRDRVGSDVVRLTHEYLALMLGAGVRASPRHFVHCKRRDWSIRTAE